MPTIPVTINKKTRTDYRRALIEMFLKEAPGATGAPSYYKYVVETDNNGNSIFLKRPAILNKGFDFEVHVSNHEFQHVSKNGRVTKNDMPSHGDILKDLADKKKEDPAQYKNLRAVIDRIYNCEEIAPQEYKAFTFKSGYPVDLICKCIKWLFIEQDITYWNWSGRHRLYDGINNI